MSLEPGTRLGMYEIQSSLGAGGMGEDTSDNHDTLKYLFIDLFKKDLVQDYWTSVRHPRLS